MKNKQKEWHPAAKPLTSLQFTIDEILIFFSEFLSIFEKLVNTVYGYLLLVRLFGT
jgi:hypothetical protein